MVCFRWTEFSTMDSTIAASISLKGASHVEYLKLSSFQTIYGFYVSPKCNYIVI